MLINSEGVVNPSLFALITKLHGPKTFTDLHAVNTFLQESWKAGPATASFQIPGNAVAADERPLLQALGLSDELSVAAANPASCDGVLVLGAAMKGLARRLAFLSKELKKFPGLLLPLRVLVSDRELIWAHEGKLSMPGIITDTGIRFSELWKESRHWPCNEAGVAEFLLKYSDVAEHCRGLPYVLETRSNEGKLAGAADTIGNFLFTQGADTGPRRSLIVSSQPFCHHHALVANRMSRAAGGNFSFSVCGPAVAADLNLQKYLDVLAKSFQEELLLQNPVA